MFLKTEKTDIPLNKRNITKEKKTRRTQLRVFLFQSNKMFFPFVFFLYAYQKYALQNYNKYVILES